MVAEEKENAEVSNLSELLADKAVFGDFVEVDFDVQGYANTVINSHKVGEQLAQLSLAINLLNKELMSQVSANHEDLLSQATCIETLEGVLQSIQTRILSLVKSIERIKSQVSEPYNRIASRTRQLRRLQVTCDYLRRILRILQLNKRLQQQLNDVTKAAQTLNELDYVIEGCDLSGIQVITNDIVQIKETRSLVEKQAVEMFKQGLLTQNQPTIATSLQVFHNLGSLTSRVENVLTDVSQTTNDAIKSSLESSENHSAISRATLWEKMESLMKILLGNCQKVYLMEKVLAKKRDPITQASFIQSFSREGRSTVFNSFWNSICSQLRCNLDQSVEESSTLREIFEGEYPKLLRMFNDFWTNVTSFLDSNVQQSSFNKTEVKIGFLDDESPLSSLKASLQPFERAYLSRALSRLFDPINLVFPPGSTAVPSKEELNGIIKAITSELGVAGVDEQLMLLVSKNIAETIQLYVSKCEQLLVTSREAGQLSGGLTNSQIRNASIVNSLYHLHTAIVEMIPNLTYPPTEVLDTLDLMLKSISALMDLALSLILSPVMATLENKILKLHSENFSISTKTYKEISGSCSRYIQEIEEFITRFKCDYLSLYTCEEFLVERLEEIACRLLDLFVRHASMVRDLSEGGRLKLSADMSRLELAVCPALCPRIEDLQQSYKLFRSFRTLLFERMEEIPNNSSVGESVPYSTALYFLFSRAPPHMLSPHTVAGWSAGEISQWLDEHTDENERIALISGTVEAFSQKIQDEPPLVYNILKQLLNNFEK